LNSSVDFEGPIKEIEKLEQEKQALHEHKQQIEDKLKEQQKEVEIEKQQKAQLENILQKMQQKLVIGGKALEETEKERAKQVREMQLKLEKQKKIEQELFQQKKEQEEEKLMVERQYKDLQEEVDENRKIIKELRMRYVAAIQEIEDIKKENQDNNEDNLITIREQASEIEFYQKLVKNLLKPEEVVQIKARSKHYDDGWTVPPFVLKKHELNFPKLSRGKARGLVDDELNQRDIEFDVSYNGENNLSANSINKAAVNTVKINKNASSKKPLNLESGLLSPKSGNDIRFSYDQEPPKYMSKISSKPNRHKAPKNISAQPPANIKPYSNYFEEEEPPGIRSMKKPNPTLAPIQLKPMNVLDLSSANKQTNLEAMIPSVDELRKRRGDLQPLKYDATVWRNNSYDSQE
jgi:myosin heavy subunit